MAEPDILPANFTLSQAAKRAIEEVKKSHDARFPDPAALLCIGWGIAIPHDAGPRVENVVISFYPQSMLDEVAHGIQVVSGIPLIFFTTEEYQHKFEGKILDHDPERGFYLRSRAG